MKKDKNGNPTRFEARIVAGGNFQIKGIDYDDVNVPVIDFSIIRICIVLNFNNNWKTRHVDVRFAFLNSAIGKETYAKSPVNLPNVMRHHDVYLLLNALYGLHQSLYYGIEICALLFFKWVSLRKNLTLLFLL